MKRIIKYNISKEDSIGSRTKSVSFSSNSASNSSSFEDDDKLNINCQLWGNDFNGGSIDSTMQVYGDIYLYNPNEKDDDVDEDDDDVDDGTVGGGLLGDEDDDEDEIDNSTGTLYSYGVESTDIYAKKKLWVHYPTVNDEKQNVPDLIKNNADKIATNAANIQTNKTNIANNATNIAANKAEIDALKGRVTTAETNITNISNHQADQDVMINTNVVEILDLKKRTSNNEGDITNIYQMIEDINTDIEAVTGEVPTKVSQLENDAHYITLDDLPEADYKTPVILFSGTFVSDNNDGSLTWQPWKFGTYAFNAKVSSAGVGYAYNADDTRIPSIEINLYPKTGYSLKALSVSAMVTKATDYNVFTSAAGGNPRSKGYWCTGGVGENGRIYIGAWRTQDDNNDSVRWDCLGYKCQEISVTIYGTISKNE